MEGGRGAQIDRRGGDGSILRRSRGGRPRAGSKLPLGRAVALVLIGVSISCARPQQALPVAGDSIWDRAATDPGARRGGAPSWAMEPVSWGKLDAIERWIEQNRRPAPFWRVESRLQLAEGQLHFSMEPGTAPGTRRFRRNAALDGFRAVLEDSGANRDQQLRARQGSRAAGTGEAGRATPAAAEAPVPGLIGRRHWRAAPAITRNMTPASGRWSWITVHHSVSASSSNSLSASLDTVRGIQREHMNRSQPYGDIGYHFLIDRAGRIIEGRKLRWQGAHAGGANNRGNVGICLIGNFEVEEPTRAAISALERLVFELQSELGIPRRNVKPHLDWKETKCPGKNLMPWFARR